MKRKPTWQSMDVRSLSRCRNGPTRKSATALNRSYAEFKRWFEVDIYSMVLDMGADAIQFD